MDRLVDLQNSRSIDQDLKSLTLLLQKANGQLSPHLQEGIFFFGQTGSGKKGSSLLQRQQDRRPKGFLKVQAKHGNQDNPETHRNSAVVHA